MIADAGRSGAGAFTITLSPIGDAIVCPAGENVLGAILRSGAKIVFGCRGGGCGACKVRLVSGTVDHGRYSVAVLPEEEKASGAFLSCQARPLSDLTVELTAANKYRGPIAGWGGLGR